MGKRGQVTETSLKTPRRAIGHGHPKDAGVLSVRALWRRACEYGSAGHLDSAQLVLHRRVELLERRIPGQHRVNLGLPMEKQGVE